MIIRSQFPSSLLPPFSYRVGPFSKAFERHKSRYRVALHEARFEKAEDIARKARSIMVAKEPRWSALIKNDLFGDLVELARSAEGVTQFRAAEVLKTIRVYRNSESTVQYFDQTCSAHPARSRKSKRRCRRSRARTRARIRTSQQRHYRHRLRHQDPARWVSILDRRFPSGAIPEPLVVLVTT